MRLSGYLEPELVLLDLGTSGVEETIAAFVDRLREADRVTDPGTVAQALIEREASHSTALGDGVALPHATVPGVSEPVLLIGTAPRGVPFGKSGAQPIRLFFVLLSPLERAGTHIKLLARIVRLVRQPGFVTSLLEAESGEAVVGAIARVDALHV